MRVNKSRQAAEKRVDSESAASKDVWRWQLRKKTDLKALSVPQRNPLEMKVLKFASTGRWYWCLDRSGAKLVSSNSYTTKSKCKSTLANLMRAIQEGNYKVYEDS